MQRGHRFAISVVVGLAPLVASVAPAYPQEDLTGSAGDLGELNLEGLLRLKVVTASGGVAEESDLAPANVFTILGSEIANQGWQSVAEVLTHVPGIYIVDDYVTQNVGVRGASGGLRAGSRIIKVMINGADISFRPDSNALIGPEFIPIDMVERIEIARGPLSALYGANAFLATVNIITSDPDRRVAGLAAVSGMARQTQGSARFGGGLRGLVTSKPNARVRVQLGVSAERTDRGGLTLKQTFAGQDVTAQRLGETSRMDLSRPIALFARVMLDGRAAGQFNLQGGLQQSDSNGNFQLGSIMTGQTRSVIRNVWSDLQHQVRLGSRLSTNSSVGFSFGAPTQDDRLFQTGDLVQDPATMTGIPDQYRHYFTRNFNYRAADAKTAMTFQPVESFRVSAGIDATLEKHRKLYYSETWLVDEGPNMGVGQTRVVSDVGTEDLYIQVLKIAPNLHTTYSPISNIRLSADARIDKIDLFPTQYSWRAAAGWRILPNLVVKVIAGRAFQTPSTVFLYGFPGFGGTGDFQGSRNVRGSTQTLVPQVVQSSEIVANYVRGDMLSVNVAGYWQAIDNQIALRSLGPLYYPQNQGIARSYGTEVNVTGRVWRFEPYARISKQWFQTNPTRSDTDTGPNVPPALIPSYWALVGLRANVHIPRLTFDAVYVLVGERGATQSNIFRNSGQSYALPSYRQLDLSATATFAWLGRNRDTRITLVTRNLMGETHFEPGNGGIDIPTLGRSGQLVLSQSF